MILYDFPQGSPEWIAARVGIPTASNFDKIITPAKGDVSKSQPKYLARLLAEWFLGVALDDFTSDFMERGKEMEAEAIGYYRFQTDLEPRAIGFVTDDTGRVGASPDQLVGDDGLLEVKCPSAEVHMDYLINGGPAADYWCQLQGQLWVCGRQWVDILSFHPILPRKILRVPRDDEFIAKMAEATHSFVQRLDAFKEKYAEQRQREVDARAAAAAIEGDGQELLI